MRLINILGGCLMLAGFAAAGDMAVYTDSLQNSWQNWSWATVNFNNASPVHSGASSIRVSCTNYQGLYLHHAALDAAVYTNLVFWIHGGTSGGQSLSVRATVNQTALNPWYAIPSPAAGAWQQVRIPFRSLGVSNQTSLDGFWIQSNSGGQLPVFYVDDISLEEGPTTPPATNSLTAIRIDAALDRHPISPLIYGVAFANSASVLADLNAPLHRSGGNAETRYNWQINAHNRGADWYFESLADTSSTAGAEADTFVSKSKTGGAEPMLTIPMIGWVPKLGSGRSRLASYSIAKYGRQTGYDTNWFPDAGNGISVTNKTLITWNDPNDANVATTSAFQQEWVKHLTNRWGLATNGGVRFYLMDNEHSIWHSTHRDVHPIGATMREIRDRFFDYAAKVKAVDPEALVCGPEEFGWSGYFYSGYDLQYGDQHGWGYLPDRATNGGWDYLPWLLDQFRQRATNTNQRLLDYFTVHRYPEDGNISGGDTSTSTQLLRNRSTRSFWDTNYVDETWINGVVKLIPRLKQWVDSYYPGTKIGITEYNWGAENHINGATTQADILGIFGREGLDLATRWTTPGTNTPTYKAMKMFRNYDGNKSTFGDTCVSASGPNPDNVSVFGAMRSSDGALTLMVINKQLTAVAQAAVTLTNFLPGGTAQMWRLTSSNAITRLSDLSFSGNSFASTLPAQSITLFILPEGTRPRLKVLALQSGGILDLRLEGVVGERYVLQATTDFFEYVPVRTNVLVSNSIVMSVAVTNAMRFYRAQWVSQ